MTDLPNGPFDVIYADPPWSYRDGGNPDGGVDHEYDTMSIDDICALDVPAADTCYLYLWSTVTHVPEALRVLREWGFEYKSQAVWDKQRLGIGHYWRGQHELLYLGVRGDVSPPPTEHRRGSIFREKAGKHSAKPDVVRTHIEQAHPDARKLEMFARDGKVGWELWGDESPDSKQATLGRQP